MSGHKGKQNKAEDTTGGEVYADSLVVAASTIMAIALSRKESDR
jgi:hypothetical protein